MDQGLELFTGCRFDRFLCKLHLKADTIGQAAIRGLVLGGLAWVPMAIWSLISGNAQAPETRLRFFYDFAAYAQFWIGIPLLSIAQVFIGRRITQAVRYLSESGVVDDGDRGRFDAILKKSERLACSGIIEMILIPLSYITPIVWLVQEVTNDASTWHALARNHITLAGFWDGAIAVPLFWYLIYRWIWRVVVWSLALFKTTRLGLRLRASHPDRMAGLAIISRVQATFGIILFVFGCVIAATVLYKALIEHSMMSAVSVWSMVVAYVILGPLAFMAPMLVFSPQLARLKRESGLQYGRLGALYARRFEDKWLGRGTSCGEELLGNPDIGALADLGASYDRATSLKIIPFDLGNLAKLATAAFGPMIPLITKYLPIGKTLKEILGIFGGN